MIKARKKEMKEGGKKRARVHRQRFSSSGRIARPAGTTKGKEGLV